jgi:hypothetical protein
MRQWSVKSAIRRVENPRVVHYGYEQVFIRQAWCTDRPHSFCEDGPCAASYRFAVVVGEDNKPRLQIQSLPASAVFLSGKALLKG